jgi:spoIIIJ-associated protein
VTDSVEARGASVDDAVEQALRELGLGEDDVMIEVLAEGRRGLFGSAKRAHVRVTPKAVPLHDDEENAVEDIDTAGQDAEAPAASDNGTPATASTDGAVEGGDGDGATAVELVDEEADLAADFVEGLLDLLDLPGDIEIEVHEDQAVVTIQDVGSGLLIGRRGATLDALQELVRCAVQRQTERRSHVRVDVEGYRARHLDKLRSKCRDAIAEVRETGEAVRLEPMDAYERKLMHDIVARTGGVTSSSEGSEPKRRVVISPQSQP